MRISDWSSDVCSSDLVDVDADDKNGADKATVKLGFTSPAAPTKAADWMTAEFAKKGLKVTRSGDTLAGKDKDGADFTINFAPDGANAKGEEVIVTSRGWDRQSGVQGRSESGRVDLGGCLLVQHITTNKKKEEYIN